MRSVRIHTASASFRVRGRRGFVSDDLSIAAVNLHELNFIDAPHYKQMQAKHSQILEDSVWEFQFLTP